jgi:hypothetical protein
MSISLNMVGNSAGERLRGGFSKAMRVRLLHVELFKSF